MVKRQAALVNEPSREQDKRSPPFVDQYWGGGFTGRTDSPQARHKPKMTVPENGGFDAAGEGNPPHSQFRRLFFINIFQIDMSYLATDLPQHST